MKKRNSLVVRLMFFVSLLISFHSAFTQDFKLKDKVEVLWSGKWYPSEIIEAKEGKYKIHYVGWSSSWDEWVTTERMRSITGSSTASATGVSSSSNKTKTEEKVTAPRLGKYLIYSFGGGDATAIYMGYLLLTANDYEYYNAGKRLLGKGKFSFDPSKQELSWKNGPFKENNYTGGYEIERNGKTHKIRLLRTMICTNSTD